MPEDSSAPARRPGSLARGLLVASILCFTCGILIGLFTMQFVISDRDNPLAILALVYLLPSVAYCSAGYFVRKRRRGGGWLAVLTAALWSAPLWAYEDSPGWPWTGSALFFLAANLVIILCVVFNWRHLRPSSGQVGA